MREATQTSAKAERVNLQTDADLIIAQLHTLEEATALSPVRLLEALHQAVRHLEAHDQARHADPVARSAYARDAHARNGLDPVVWTARELSLLTLDDPLLFSKIALLREGLIAHFRARAAKVVLS